MKNRSARLPLALTAAVILFGGAGAAHADLIVNGSFENPSVGSSYQIYTNGQVPGWTSNNNELEIDNSSGIGLTAYSGTQSAELNGTGYDTISQTVTGLTVGQKYQLTWAYSGRSGGGAQQMNVTFNGVQVGSNTSDGSTNLGFVNNVVIVTATATSEVLSFAAINVGGSATVGNELDAVTLNAIAEPAALVLMLSAMTGFGLLRRRRSNKLG